jgi:hypothetical protein
VDDPDPPFGMSKAIIPRSPGSGHVRRAIGRPPRLRGGDRVGRVEHAESRLRKEIGVLHTPYKILTK